MCLTVVEVAVVRLEHYILVGHRRYPGSNAKLYNEGRAVTGHCQGIG